MYGHRDQQAFKNADHKDQTAAHERQHQCIRAIMRHMNQPCNHLVAGKHHDRRQCEFRQIIQVFRIENEKSNEETDHQHRKFRIRARQFVRRTFRQPIQIGHAAEEA